MERVDTNHSSYEGPKPILTNGHGPRKSISGMDILSGLKIITSSTASDMLPSPVASSAHTPITDSHIADQIDDFEIKEPIGYGSSAIVYKAIYKPLNKPMALKMIDLDKFERNQIDELRHETALMALCKHPNVLRVYGSFVHGSKLYIVTPFLSGGSCLDIMKTCFSEGLEETAIATILRQALEALIYLHRNGHIHRDVKAGNLLMDDDGTVLLGDFGVSSSLMETGERGMRKTFVGTPCWMAPEVMEQAEYDYKADIWSFGITSIELATGHAPFAKYPPLKVLMMTLSNDPPTLERETEAHKYSKAFKDMVDTCLVKDPNKRPTAERLLGHSFFKQARKKEYLQKYILVDLPPIEQRPRKRIPQKQIPITRIDETWDFGDDAMDADDDENEPQGLRVSKQKTYPTSRHISFGEVIVRNNSTSIHPTDQPSSHTIAVTPSRKSRFVVEEAVRDSSDIYSSSVTSSNLMHEDKDSDRASDSEVVKGRFYLNQLKAVNANENHGFDESQPLYKIPSHDFLAVDRKSRFEVQHNNGSASPMLYQSIPLSRDSSFSSAGNSNHSRSTLVTRYPTSEPKDLLTPENIALLTESSRKIGRFELTSNNEPNLAPRKSISLHNSGTDQEVSRIQSQIEELLRFNETQRTVLQDLSATFQKKQNNSPHVSEELSSNIVSVNNVLF
ncbi:kinase-like domain-containing protein [Sporodiniella umbellata]|nr:kinase-like domain-containing protein [Sporodiniella umbellata]